MQTSPSGLTRWDVEAVQAARADDETDHEADGCPHRFVRGVLTALGLVMVLWLALAAAVVVVWTR